MRSVNTTRSFGAVSRFLGSPWGCPAVLRPAEDVAPLVSLSSYSILRQVRGGWQIRPPRNEGLLLVPKDPDLPPLLKKKTGC